MPRGDWYRDEPELTENDAAVGECSTDSTRPERTTTSSAAASWKSCSPRGGPGTCVPPPFRCSYGAQISIGANRFVNNDVLFIDDATIAIGDNAWLGGGVIVCSGVTIGENAVIGAGSVVIRDIPSQVFAAGNPARIIRRL